MKHIKDKRKIRFIANIQRNNGNRRSVLETTITPALYA